MALRVPLPAASSPPRQPAGLLLRLPYHQDSCCAYSQYCRPTQALLAALDGHGPQGHHVSGFLKERLPQALAEALGEGAAAAGGSAGMVGGAAAASGGCVGGSDPTSGSFSSTAHSSAGQQQVQQRRSPSKARRSSTSGSGGSDSADGPSAAAALAGTFLRLDADVRQELGANANYSGSTAAVCMLQVGAGGCGLQRTWAGCATAPVVYPAYHRPSRSPSGCMPCPLACRGGG